MAKHCVTLLSFELSSENCELKRSEKIGIHRVSFDRFHLIRSPTRDSRTIQAAAKSQIFVREHVPIVRARVMNYDSINSRDYSRNLFLLSSAETNSHEARIENA